MQKKIITHRVDVLVDVVVALAAYWQFYQGMEAYSRDPGFDWNTVQDSGKRKISWSDKGLTSNLAWEHDSPKSWHGLR